MQAEYGNNLANLLANVISANLATKAKNVLAQAFTSNFAYATA
jgi:uncharacterized protein YejL (UPF0352 family)